MYDVIERVEIRCVASLPLVAATELDDILLVHCEFAAILSIHIHRTVIESEKYGCLFRLIVTLVFDCLIISSADGQRRYSKY
jgi:hypothetical protein